MSDDKGDSLRVDQNEFLDPRLMNFKEDCYVFSWRIFVGW